MSRTSPARRFGGLAITLATLTILATACSSSVGSTAAPQESTAAETVSYTVTHAMGTETFDAVPQRIVVIDSPHLDAIVALGIEPVGATVSGADAGFPAYLADELGDTANVGLTSEPDIDAIAALEPDLIIGAKVRHEAIFSELDAIAPTVFSENSGTDWTEQALITAAAVNETEQMQKQLDALDERAVAVGESIGAADLTASIVRFRPDNFRLYGPESFSGSLLSTVGFDLGEKEWNEYSMMELSPEQFEQASGDVIFFTNPGGDPAATTMGAVTALWTGLPAVAAGKTFEAADETWMVGIGVVGAGIILDDLETMLG